MATATILHVGRDICQRIPLMGSGGFAVSQSEDSVRAIRKVFAAGDSYSAITFHTDVFAPSEDSVWVARSLSAAPFVLFENPSFYYCNKSDFDIVIPACARPSCWLKMLHDAVRSNSRSTPVDFDRRGGVQFSPSPW